MFFKQIFLIFNQQTDIFNFQSTINYLFLKEIEEKI